MRTSVAIVALGLATAAGAVGGYFYAYSEMRANLAQAFAQIPQPRRTEPQAVPTPVPTPTVATADQPSPPAAAPSLPDKAEPQWEVTDSTNPLDDAKEVTLSMRNADPVHNQFGGEELAVLIVRCKEKKTEMLIGTSEFFGTSQDIAVSYRIDDQKAVSARWSGSTSGKGAFAPSPIPLAKKFSEGSSLFVRLETRFGRLETRFVLTGLAEHLPKVAEACNWKP